MKWFREIEPTVAPPPDLDRRRVAARLIRDFAAGTITNDALYDGWPRGPGEPALNDISYFVWFHYDDLSTHRWNGDVESAAGLLRCADFLETELPYIWKAPLWPVRIVAWALSMVTLGLAKELWDAPPWYWPYPTAEAEFASR